MIFVSTIGSLCRSVSASYQKRDGYSNVLQLLVHKCSPWKCPPPTQGVQRLAGRCGEPGGEADSLLCSFSICSEELSRRQPGGGDLCVVRPQWSGSDGLYERGSWLVPRENPEYLATAFNQSSSFLRGFLRIHIYLYDNVLYFSWRQYHGTMRNFKNILNMELKVLSMQATG